MPRAQHFVSAHVSPDVPLLLAGVSHSPRLPPTEQHFTPAETHRTCHCPHISTTPSQQHCFVSKNPCSCDIQALLLALLDAGLQTPVLDEQPSPLEGSQSGWTSSSHHPTTINVHVVKPSTHSRRTLHSPEMLFRRSRVCVHAFLSTSCSGHGVQPEPGAEIVSVFSRKVLQGCDACLPC